MPAPGATTAVLMLATPGVVAAATVARLLLQVLTPATPGAAVVTPAMLGVVAERLLLLLLVAGRLVAPPLVVAAGKVFSYLKLGFPSVPLDHGSTASCSHNALEIRGRELFGDGHSSFPVFWFRSYFPRRGC